MRNRAICPGIGSFILDNGIGKSKFKKAVGSVTKPVPKAVTKTVVAATAVVPGARQISTVRKLQDKTLSTKELSIFRKVGNVAAGTALTYFGVPAIAKLTSVKGVPLMDTIAKSKTGSWWVKAGGKAYHIFKKTKDSLPETVEVPADQAPAGIPEGGAAPDPGYTPPSSSGGSSGGGATEAGMTAGLPKWALPAVIIVGVIFTAGKLSRMGKRGKK